MAKQSKTWE
jgi:hypothetical protein